MRDTIPVNLLLKQINIKSLASVNFPTIPGTSTLQDAVEFFVTGAHCCLAVLDENKCLQGVFTAAKTIKLLAQGVDTSTTLDVLASTPQLVTAVEQAEQMTLGSVLELGVQQVMVVDSDKHLLGGLLINGLESGIIREIAEWGDVLGRVLESVYNGVVVINRQGEIMFFNHSAEQTLDFKSIDVLGQDIQRIVPGSGLLKVVETGVSQAACRVVVGDKTVITNRTPVVFRDRIIGAVGVFQDITAMESISAELSETKKLKNILEAVVENPYEGMVMVDENSNIVLMNKFYLDILGLKAEEVTGKHILEVTPNSQLSYTIRTGTDQVGEFWEVAGREFMIMRLPITREGKVVGALGKTMFKDMGMARIFAKKLIQLENDLDFYKEELSKAHAPEFTFNQIVGVSPRIDAAKEVARRASRTKSTVLITGESGTGKEVFAQALHHAGTRYQSPFIKLNCAAVPENLLESELFGYAEGAFTGARKGGKPGKFEMADNGTLFLDEIGDMSLTMQSKLLRVLQEQEIERVGGTEPIKVNVRVVAATNRNLGKMVEENLFRSDLYYRLNVVVIELPPLRDRIADVPLLTEHLLGQLNQSMGSRIKGVTRETMDILTSYTWPGNVRELGNVLERAINICDEQYIQPEHLPAAVRRQVVGRQPEFGERLLEQAIMEAEREILLNTLEATGGNKLRAARSLGIQRSVLYKKLAKHHIICPHK